jgi:hypothetical protein
MKMAAVDQHWWAARASIEFYEKDKISQQNGIAQTRGGKREA